MIAILRPCKTCGTTFPTNRSQAYCSPSCRPAPKKTNQATRQHYSDVDARALEIAASPDLRAARSLCRVLGPPEPLSVKLDRLRLAGIENRRMEGKSGCPRTNRSDPARSGN